MATPAHLDAVSSLAENKNSGYFEYPGERLS